MVRDTDPPPILAGVRPRLEIDPSPMGSLCVVIMLIVGSPGRGFGRLFVRGTEWLCCHLYGTRDSFTPIALRRTAGPLVGRVRGRRQIVGIDVFRRHGRMGLIRSNAPMMMLLLLLCVAATAEICIALCCRMVDGL